MSDQLTFPFAKRHGETAYLYYRWINNNESPVTGRELPLWADLPIGVQDAWEHAVNALEFECN